MRLSTKLQAFTITELIVVMLLSTIVFSLALMAFQITHKQYISYNQDSTQAVELDRLQSILLIDFKQCQEVQLEQRTLYCYYSNYLIKYIFKQNQVIRKSNHTNSQAQTFSFDTQHLEGAWQNETIYQGTVDYLYWSTTLFDKEYVLTLYKTYDYKMLLRQQ